MKAWPAQSAWHTTLVERPNGGYMCMLNGFDYLFDDEAGRVGFRWTGHVPEQLGGVSAARDAPDQTQGRR